MIKINNGQGKNGKEKKIKNMSKMEKGRIEGLKKELIKSKKVM